MTNKNIIFFLLLCSLTSCSIFQSKYVEVESTGGECWDEYYADLLSNELVEKNSQYSELRIEFTIKDLYGQNTESRPFDFASIKLNGQFYDYEKINDRWHSQLNIRLKPDEYQISLFSVINGIDLNIKLKEKIQVNPNEIRKLKIGITKQTICESYSIKKKILRSEWRKRNKNNQD